MRRRRSIAATAMAVILLGAVACNGPVVPHPATGESRFLCCNLWYEKPKISDVFYQWGTKIPLGTPVRVHAVRKGAVTFQPEGYPEITLVLKQGKRQMSIDTLIEQLFLVKDPRTGMKRFPKKTLQAIDQGKVVEGMTRDQVLMAVGYPPAHRTPSLQASDWTYWENRWHQWIVRFQGDKVTAFTQ